LTKRQRLDRKENNSADLSSACGRYINTAKRGDKKYQPALAQAEAGFFVFR
jgi:hypothetical protein